MLTPGGDVHVPDLRYDYARVMLTPGGDVDVPDLRSRAILTSGGDVDVPVTGDVDVPVTLRCAPDGDVDVPVTLRRQRTCAPDACLRYRRLELALSRW